MCSNLNPSGCHQLESRVRSKVHARVRRGADRKGQECTSLAAYSTKEIGRLLTMEQTSLPTRRRYGYNHYGSFHSYSLATCLFL